MASKWLREIPYSSNTTDQNMLSFWWKVYALWLRYIMGFTFVSDSYGGAGRDWTSYEKSGTLGSFAGSTYEFTDSSAPFSSSDVLKLIVINDDTNYINAGVYLITQFVSTTKIIIDYRAGYDEFPLASTGLSWWICGTSYQTPQDGDYIILESKHTDGWQIKLTAQTYFDNGVNYKLRIAVAPGGNWSKELSWTHPSYGHGGGLSLYPYRYLVFFWAEGDFDNHDSLHLWQHYVQVDSNWTRPMINLVSIEHVLPIEAGHSSDELLVLKMASSGNVSNSNYGGRNYDDSGTGFSWSDVLNRVVVGYLFDYSISGAQTNLLTSAILNEGRETNYRLDDKKEIYKGSYYVVDPNNSIGAYNVLGIMNGHWSVPVYPFYRGDNYNPWVGYGYMSSRHASMALTKDSPGDLLLLLDDIAIPWCNLSIRGNL